MKRKAWLISVSIALVCCIIAAAVTAQALLRYPDSRKEPTPASLSFTHVPWVNVSENPGSGVNLGVALKGLNGSDWGIEPDAGDFNALRDAGFRYARVPVQFLPYLERMDEAAGSEGASGVEGTAGAGGGYRLDEAMLARLDAILNAILERGMTAILDFHCLLSEDVYAFTNQREKRDNEERFLAVWAILADRYRDWPAELYFELANEPRRPIMPDDWNRYVSEALALIRASGGGNRTRMVVAANPILVGPVFRSWENGRGIDRLAIPSPEDDPNIIVTVHYYDPVPFTYQGQTYNESLKRYSRFWEGNRWANTERQRTLVRRDFDRIARWAADNRRQVILGEFGVSVFADERSQINWTELVREEAESRGMIWLFWQFFYEYGGDTLGGLWSHAGRFWRVEMVDALQTRERRRNEPPAPPDLSEEEMRAVDQAAAELRAPEWTVREAAARSLAEGEILTDGAASALIAALSADEEWQVRRAAADALYACRPVPAAALPALTEALSHPEWQIRHSAARALGRMGFAAEPALPALRALLADPEWKPREAALLALVFIAPEDGGTRDALRQALSDPEEHIRDTARTLSRHPGLWYRDMVGRRPGRGDTRQ